MRALKIQILVVQLKNKKTKLTVYVAFEAVYDKRIFW